MRSLYVVCELGADVGHLVMLGTLHGREFIISEVRRFENQLSRDNDPFAGIFLNFIRKLSKGCGTIRAYDEDVTVLAAIRPLPITFCSPLMAHS